jgi:hypothetical protein
MTDDLSERLSVWPSAMPSLPVVLSDPPVEADHRKDALIVGVDTFEVSDASERDRLATLPDTFFWRELSDLDVSSLDKLAEFANCWGVPFVPREGLTFKDWQRAASSELPQFTFDLPAEEARDAVRLLRNMVRVWQLVVGAISEEAYVEGWEPCDPHGAVPNARLDVPPQGDLARMGLLDLTCIVGHGIKEFSPYIRMSAGRPTATLFAATCAQLFNAVAERRVWHRCAKCDRPFLRKWGTERVQYCGPACARAASSKAYRDRRRAKGLAATSEDKS